MVYAEAHKRRLDITEHDGELSAMVAFTEQIAENAIERHLFPLLSTGESASIDFHNYLKQLEKEGQCYFLPFKLHHIMIKNIGIHSNLDLTLDSLNVI